MGHVEGCDEMAQNRPGGGQARRVGRLRRSVTLAAVAAAGASLLTLGAPTTASANQPDPPLPPGFVRTFAQEYVPPVCPTVAPPGTIVPAGVDVRVACETAETMAPTPEAAAAIRYAFGNLGARYSQSDRYAMNPPKFDCTSLISRAYDAAGAWIIRGDNTFRWGAGGVFGWTGSYLPQYYEGSNLTRVASFSQLQPGDVIIEFNGSTPAGSVGDGGHAQLYLGNGLVIQSGGEHPESVVNVDRHTNEFDNAWYFRWNAAGATDPVARKWPWVANLLGRQLGPVEPAGPAAQVSRHERGFLFRSPLVGIHEVHGDIARRYAMIGREAHPLGLPNSDERAAAIPGVRVSYFQRGAIYWTPATGPVEVYGSIAGRYRAIGSETSRLRLPLTAERPGSAPGSRVQQFQGGRMYWSAASGAYEVQGSILLSYSLLGGESSFLGLPITPELDGPVPGSRVSYFQHGAIYWSPRTGPIATRGEIGGRYHRDRLGRLIGLPTAYEVAAAVPGASKQQFQNGRMYSSAATGTYEVRGSIEALHGALGAEAGILGLPASDELNGPIPWSRVSYFERGAIYWSPWTGAVVTRGAIGDAYRIRGLSPALGLPVAPEKDAAVPGSRVQGFQKGRIYWSPATGAQPVYGSILMRYSALGAETSALGLPVRGEYPTPQGRAVDFEGGRIAWDARTGAVTVTVS